MTRVMIGILACAVGGYLAGGGLLLASFGAALASGAIIAQRFRVSSGEGKGWSSPLIAFITGYLVLLFGVCPLAAIGASYAGVDVSWLSCGVGTATGLCVICATIYAANLPRSL